MMKKTEKKVMDSKAEGRLKSVLALILVSCIVIGLLSSTAIKLASATLLMKNTAIKSDNPVVQQLGDALNIPVEPATPVTPAPSTGTNSGSSSNSGSNTNTTTTTVAAPSTTEKVEDTTKTPETQAPETQAPETEAPETEEETVDPIVLAKDYQKVIKTYNKVLARAKVVGAQPSFVKTTTRTATSPIGIIDGMVADANSDYFVYKKSIAVPKGKVSNELCINNEKYACLFDGKDLEAVASAISYAEKFELEDGNVCIYIELNDEENPVPLAEGSDKAESFTAAFVPVVSSDAVKEMANKGIPTGVDSANLTYTGCTIELIYNPSTGEIVSLNQTANYDVDMGFYKLSVSDVTDYTTFVY